MYSSLLGILRLVEDDVAKAFGHAEPPIDHGLGIHHGTVILKDLAQMLGRHVARQVAHNELRR